MPYVTEQERQEIDSYLIGEDFYGVGPGQLTYMLYRIMLSSLPDDPRYSDYSTVLGAVEAAKLEFYRRQVAPYEDKKIEENGDVI